MVKGCQRKMIVVQGKDKSVFEMAYFVLRRESEKRSFRDGELLEEANRIINEACFRREKENGRRRSRWWSLLLWLGGCLIGCGGTLLLTHLFS